VILMAPLCARDAGRVLNAPLKRSERSLWRHIRVDL